MDTPHAENLCAERLNPIYICIYIYIYITLFYLKILKQPYFLKYNPTVTFACRSTRSWRSRRSPSSADAPPSRPKYRRRTLATSLFYMLSGY